VERRRLGQTDLLLAPLVLGGNVFGWTVDTSQTFAMLDAFIDAGFNTIDTADAYSAWVPGHVGGESEHVIGQWIKARGLRDRLVIATKVGATLGPVNDATGQRVGYTINLTAPHIVTSVESSLRRLQTDYIDLYQSHADDGQTSMDETLEAYSRLISSGKVRYVGASNFSAERLSLALELSESGRLPRYQSLQPLYNLYDRSQFEGDLQNLCVANDVGVICLTSLAKGFLTGKYRSTEESSVSVWSERLTRYQNDRGYRILDALDLIAEQLGASPAQIALAWLLAQPGVTAPIVAAASLEQLREIMGAPRLQLSGEHRDLLTNAGI